MIAGWADVYTRVVSNFTHKIDKKGEEEEEENKTEEENEAARTNRWVWMSDMIV